MKKAVILAGGKGTRLSPLTDDIPKPLMPFLGKTLIERILDKLKSSGIENVVISTMHMSDKIIQKLGESYNDIGIKYFIETTPLGTAGGMKKAKELLSPEENEKILVISGDCVCDFDLKKIIEQHEQKDYDATIITVECDNPLEYGIVLSDKGGLIQGFSEKPSWAQVNCNRVNTGIYILNSQVIDIIPDTPYDFAKDLFPKMLNNGMKLFEYTADGYWCDIGSPESYYKSCIDALEGKIRSFCPQPDGTVFIDESVNKSENSHIGPNVSVENSCVIGKNSRIAGSIIHENVNIGENTRIEGAIICNGAKIGNRCHIEGGTVIGSGVNLPDGSQIRSGSIITSGRSVHTERLDDSMLFGSESGIELLDSSMCKHLGACLSEAVGAGGRIGVMYDACGFTRAYALSLFSGLEKRKARVFDFGEGTENLAKFASISFKTDCFIYISDTEGKVFAKLYNRNGLLPSHDFERKLKKIYRENSVTEPNENNNFIEKASVKALYSCAVSDQLKSFCTKESFNRVKVAFADNDNHLEMTELERAFVELGGIVTDKKDAVEESDYIVNMSKNGEMSVSQGNYTFDCDHMTAALLIKEKADGVCSFTLPYLYPERVTEMLEGTDLFRYPFESSYRFTFPKSSLTDTKLLNDAVLLTARFLSYIISQKINLSKLAYDIPTFVYKRKIVNIPEGITKTAIIKKLSSNIEKNYCCDSYEGITVCYPNGKVTVVPGRSEIFKLYSEAANSEIADELVELTENRMFKE